MFSNNYVGNHALIILSKKISDDGHLNHTDISFKVSVYDGHQELLKRVQKGFSCFGGSGESRNIIVWYKVPIDLPVKNELEAKVELDGNLEKFLADHRSAKFIIKKMSDL